ncbi:MAG: hypothetical protein RTU30_11580 [Candidatus Thorarchaeota archaeon]
MSKKSYCKKKRYTTVCLALALLLCVAASGPQMCSGSTIWSDSFDDGDYNDWVVLAGSVSASEYNLRVTSIGYAVVYRNSTVVTGTWSFDLDMTDDIDDVQVCFITKNIDGVLVRDNYLIENTGDDNGFRLVRWIWTGSNMEFLILDSFTPSGGIAGWHHFDITRSLSGEINVYLNGTHVMDSTDTTHDTSSCFVFNIPVGPSGLGPAIDNIVVSDSIDITPPTETTSTTESTGTTTPPTPFTIDTTMLIILGIGGLIVVVIIVIVMKRR